MYFIKPTGSRKSCKILAIDWLLAFHCKGWNFGFYLVFSHVFEILCENWAIDCLVTSEILIFTLYFLWSQNKPLIFPYFFKLFGHNREDIFKYCLVALFRGEVLYSYVSLVNPQKLTDNDVNIHKTVSYFGDVFPVQCNHRTEFYMYAE